MEIVDRNVPLTEIGKTVGPRPPSRFIRSVRRHGIIVPVLLEERFQEDGLIRYHIVDGNRRVAAARRAKCREVPARILQGISPDEAARVTLATNSYRSSNYVTEFWAIKQLERSGVNRRVIAQDADMSESVMATRDLLSKLDRRIFVGFVEGKIPPTTVLAASRLPRDIQDQLGSRFMNVGRLLKREVDTAAPWRGSPSQFPSERYRQHQEPIPDPAESLPVTSSSRIDGLLRTETRAPLIPPSPVRPAEPAEVYGPPVTQEPRVFVNVLDTAPGIDPVPTFRPERDSAGAVVLAPASVPPITANLQNGNASVPPNPQPHSERPPGEGEVAAVRERLGAVTHDIRFALRTIARQAGNAGIDEDTWVAAAREAYHDRR